MTSGSVSSIFLVDEIYLSLLTKLGDHPLRGRLSHCSDRLALPWKDRSYQVHIVKYVDKLIDLRSLLSEILEI